MIYLTNKQGDLTITFAYNAKMNMETLRLFCEVMQYLSFSEVAKTRNVAPSSISRAISVLESELEIKLFQRSTRSLKPTEAGEIYFKRVSLALVELEEAKQLAKDLNNSPQGLLRVTASTVFGKMYIVPLLDELLLKYPLLTIELLLTDSYVDLIEERIDVAIRLGSLRDSSYIAKKLLDMKFYICASPNYVNRNGLPLRPSDLTKHNCLLFPREAYNNQWLFKDSNNNMTNIAVRGNCTITNSEAIKQSAVNGIGITLLPDWLIQSEINSQLLVKLFESYSVTATDYDSAVWMLTPSRRYVPSKTKVFMDHLINTMVPVSS